MSRDAERERDPGARGLDAAAHELDAWDFALPPERIAQHPAPERDAARMLVLPRAGGPLRHAGVRDLPGELREGDLLVVNATRVLTARLRGRKASGGAAETLLLEAEDPAAGLYRALVKSSGRQRVGLKLRFGGEPDALDAEIAALLPEGEVRLRFPPGSDPYARGEPPLPPYIRRDAPERADVERYQTVFAREPGAVAAPTAGLHLSPALLRAIEAGGVECAEVVLHVGAGTFRAPTARDLAEGWLHAERYELSEAVAEAVERTRARGGRVVAVGTTSTRVLETCAAPDGAGRVIPGRGETRLFLRPGARFAVVDGLLTNFHLPRSSLLMLVAAFLGPGGRERLLAAYAEALREGYRFFSYGDAMWIPPERDDGPGAA